MFSNDLLQTALRIGSLMLSYGAEIYRAEESVVRICKSYDAKEIHVFAIPSSMIVTLYMENESSLTLSKKIEPMETDLYIIDELNNLSRFICNNKPDLSEINKCIDEIMSKKPYHQFIIVLSYAIIPAVFCLFFGGNLKDMLFSMFIGVIMKYLLDKLQSFKANLIFVNTICSAVASLLAITFVKIGFADNYDKMIIGSIMLLVPGLILTNSMRDFMMGDLMTGMVRLIEAILVASGIAIGVAIVLTLFGVNKII